jgi:hypothetical protein
LKNVIVTGISIPRDLLQLVETQRGDISRSKGNGKLHEAILLAGQPVFITYDDNGEVNVVQNVEEATRTLVPPNAEEYPYEPYQFANIEEVKLYVSRAKKKQLTRFIKSQSPLFTNTTISFSLLFLY